MEEEVAKEESKFISNEDIHLFPAEWNIPSDISFVLSNTHFAAVCLALVITPVLLMLLGKLFPVSDRPYYDPYPEYTKDDILNGAYNMFDENLENHYDRRRKKEKNYSSYMQKLSGIRDEALNYLGVLSDVVSYISRRMKHIPLQANKRDYQKFLLMREREYDVTSSLYEDEKWSSDRFVEPNYQTRTKRPTSKVAHALEKSYYLK